jgi:hypothetical protein
VYQLKFGGKMIISGSNPNITGYGTCSTGNAGVGATEPSMLQTYNLEINKAIAPLISLWKRRYTISNSMHYYYYYYY